MSKLILYVFILFMALIGGGSTVYVVLSFPVVLAWKIYRKIRYKENIM